MTLEEFKGKAKSTGYQFERYAFSKMLNCFFAEIPSMRSGVTLYYPNIMNGITLTRHENGVTDTMFFKTFEEVKNYKEMEKTN